MARNAHLERLGWYFNHQGRRVWAATKREIHALAKEIANATGKPVTVRPTRPKTAPKRKAITAKRNPDPGSLVHVLHQLEIGKAARREYVAATKGRRLAKSLTRRGRAGELAEAGGTQKTGRYVVNATSGRDKLTLYRPSRTAADQLVGQLQAAGYKTTVKPV